MRTVASRLLDPAARTITAVFDRLPAGRPRIVVLTYHRVAPRHADDPLLPGMVSATPDEFEAHIEIVRARADLIGVEDLLAVLDRGSLRRPAAMLTFDDAYRDVAVHAGPVLKSQSAPAVLFVPTGFVDGPRRAFWWDRLHHAVTRTTRSTLETADGMLRIADAADRQRAWRLLRGRIKAMEHEAAMAYVDELCAALDVEAPASGVMTWEEVRRLADDGMAIAGHTVEHPLLTRVTPERVHHEVVTAMDEIAERLGSRFPLFAYPSGAYDAGVARIVRSSGVRAAFTTDRGSFRPGGNAMMLPRVNVGPRTTAAILGAEMAVLGRIGSPRGT